MIALAGGGALGVASPAAAAACPDQFVCLYDLPGWKGQREIRPCRSTPIQPIIALRARASSAINCCRVRIDLLAFDPSAPVAGLGLGRQPRLSAPVWAASGVWGLGGWRAMDNRAIRIVVRG